MNQRDILHIDAVLVDKAVSLWQTGQLVAFPTETVYGLGADATNGEAVARIYSVKSRPQFNPLIVHVSDVDIAKQFVAWTPIADQLAAAFWPGPLTLILKRKTGGPISELVSAGGDTIGIRIPNHPVALQLLRAFGGGIAAPSANRSGRVSPTTAAHVEAELGGAIPLIIDGGPSNVGLESTVLDLSGDAPVILRPGSITREMLTAIVGTLSDPQTPAKSATLKSPGLLESHYAPSLLVRLNAQKVTANEALLAFGENALNGAAKTLNLSSTANLIEAAANLFAHLRVLDDPSFSAIAVMPIPEMGIGEAINDRLRRAAATREI